ncbi:hypothetical protein D3C72_911600 [compost metagenome]
MTVAFWRRPTSLLAGLVLTAAACAADPLIGVAPLTDATPEGPALQISYSVEGPRLSTASDVVYYLVLDTNGRADDGPRINGAAPRTYPAPDPRAFLPFVRSEDDLLDREPVTVEDSRWTDYVALVQEGGTWAMWHGRRQADGTLTDRVRALTPGTEWGIQDGRTVQLRLPLKDLALPTPMPAQFEANLAVSRRMGGRGHVIDAWRPEPRASVDPNRRNDTGLPGFYRTMSTYSKTYFAIPTTGETRAETDPSAIAVPDLAVGPINALNIVGYSARVTGLASPAPASPAP